MVAGVIWSNEAVKKMAKMVHLPFQVGWKSNSTDRQARAVIGKYRATFGNGSLFVSFIAALAAFGIGGVMFVFGR